MQKKVARAAIRQVSPQLEVIKTSTSMQTSPVRSEKYIMISSVICKIEFLSVGGKDLKGFPSARELSGKNEPMSTMQKPLQHKSGAPLPAERRFCSYHSRDFA
jgi:hypothetical protein